MGRLRAAWVAGDFSAVFREFRRLTGDSQLKLGSMVGMPQSHVSLIEAGKRKVTSADVIARIAEGLAVPDQLRGLPEQNRVPTQWSPDPELSERVARATQAGRVDTSTAEFIGRVLTEHRKAEDTIGGQNLWVLVLSQLDTVTQLLPAVSGEAADRLLLLSAEHAHWLSWVARSQGKRGPSLEWLDKAYGWALDCGNAEMRAWLTRVRSFYALKEGDPKRALKIAEAGNEMSYRLSPATRSIALHAEAMASAAVGERDRSRRLAEEAHGLALQVPGENERPAWLYWLDPVRADLNLADSAYASRDWATAAGLYGEAVQALEGFPRDQAVYLTRLEDARRHM
jgi:transcriptional regulator with XRE-family HTH domain